jgi:hypothetical protein
MIRMVRGILDGAISQSNEGDILPRNNLVRLKPFWLAYITCKDMCKNAWQICAAKPSSACSPHKPNMKDNFAINILASTSLA